MTVDPLAVVAAVASATVWAGLMAALVPPSRRLAGRVRPYAAGARSALGLAPDALPAISGPGRASLTHLALQATSRWLSRLIDRVGEDELLMRIRQAGWFDDADDVTRVAEYRTRQLWATAVGVIGGTAIGIVLGFDSVRVMILAALGFLVGATRLRGRLDRAIDDRRTLMRLELYTVDQLLAVHVRSGSGVVQSVQQLTASARGEVIGELSEALRLHRSGIPASAAFRRIAEVTPEPACARTYSLLASADERGFDLAAGLLAMARDLRETRREEMRRMATRRRAAMLVPTIAVLAPVMLLFVAAPLPSLVFSWR